MWLTRSGYSAASSQHHHRIPVSRSILPLMWRESASGRSRHGRPVSTGVDVLPTLRVLFGHISACCGSMAVAMRYRKGLQRV